jgi:hypothetical protein
MIPKSGNRFSEKIMLEQRNRACFIPISIGVKRACEGSKGRTASVLIKTEPEKGQQGD